MAITENDVRLYASERMTDFADGGGAMSPTVIVDGLDNNVFPDVTDIDRLTGRMNARKLFGAVVSADADTYMSAHALLDDPADDPYTHAALLHLGDFASTLGGITEAFNDTARHYGVGVSALGAASGATSITITNAQVRLVPSSTTVIVPGSTTVTPGETHTSTYAGPVVSEATAGFVATGVSVALTATTGLITVAEDLPLGKLDAGSIAGTVVVNGVAQTAALTRGGTVITVGGRQYTQAAFDDLQWVYTGVANGDTVGASTLTASVCHPVSAVPETVNIDVSGGGLGFSIGLAAGVALGSTLLRFKPTGLVNPLVETTKFASDYFPGTDATGDYVSEVSINRATGALNAVFNSALTMLQVSHLRSANAAAITGVGTVTLSGAGQATFPVDSGFQFNSAEFKIDGALAYVALGVVRLYPSENVLGSVTTGGVMTLPTRPGASITQFRGTQKAAIEAVSSFVGTTGANLVAGSVVLSGETLAGAPFTVTSTASGDDSLFSTSPVSGKYVRAGATTILTFSTPVKAASLSASSTTSYTDPDVTVVIPDTVEVVPSTMVLPYGVSPGDYTNLVPLFKNSDNLLIHSTIGMTPATVSNAQTVTTGRVNLTRLRVIGNSGVEHARFTLGVPAPTGVGCTANLTAGTVTFTDVSGMSQPVTVEHRIEEMVQATTVYPTTGVLTLNRALTRDFPAGTKVSSLCMLGDLQGRVIGGFAQSAWTGVFSDTVLGGTPTADFNDAVYPIVTTNAGAITDRWVFIFTNTTAFRCIGELVGEIASGNVGVTYAPLNPATGAPYFTVPALGWGTGWAAGNVYRFNTSGAQSPLWVLRTVAPSAPNPASDSVTVEFRGYVNT